MIYESVGTSGRALSDRLCQGYGVVNLIRAKIGITIAIATMRTILQLAVSCPARGKMLFQWAVALPPVPKILKQTING